MEWQEADPREQLAALDRASIAVCVDERIFGGLVNLETWRIWFDPNHLSREGLDPDEKWPRGWRWVQVPRTGRGRHR